MAASETAAGAAGDVELMLAAAKEAGPIAMRYFRADARAWTKSGDSPVSEADIEVDRHLRRVLLGTRPDYGWLSEEATPGDERLGRETMFVVDPLDGTRGFLSGDPHWCLCLAVVRAGRPIGAVLHCPALGRTFSATAGQGAWLNGNRIDNAASGEIKAVTGSRRLNLEMAKRLAGRVEVLPFIPSLAYRLALVATGEIDGAFVHAGAHDWDIAAADLILSEVGGCILTPDGEPVRYTATRQRAPSLLAAGPGRRDALLALAQSGGFLQ